MLSIRPEQVKVLDDNAIADFQEKMIEHIEKFFPQHYEALGEEKSRALVDYGIASAAEYDVVSERDVCKYIDLMLGLGVEFDKSEKCAWAAQILEQDTDPSDRINAVYDRALEIIKTRP